MTMTTAEVIADSVNPAGVRLTTMSLKFPRFLLAQFNTHRQFSRNAASMRAVPTRKMVDQLRTQAFVPGEFRSNRPGMVAGDPITDNRANVAEMTWKTAASHAMAAAQALDELGVHKQWSNRLLEPFAWVSVLVTATDWDNFFRLRIADDAQPEMQELAQTMRMAMDTSEPKLVAEGQWHLPYVKDENESTLRLLPISVARCARVSYMQHDGTRDLARDVELHDRLKQQGHWSPFEHQAQSCSDNWRRANLQGWQSYRSILGF